MDPEVLGAGAVLDAVELGQALALDLRDLRLAALDRVQARERRERSRSGGPGASTHSAVSAVGSAPISPPAASTKSSQRPTWPASSAAWRRARRASLGRALGGVGAESRDRLGRVAVLAGVARRAPRGSARPPTSAGRRGARARCARARLCFDPLPDALAHGSLSPLGSDGRGTEEHTEPVRRSAPPRARHRRPALPARIWVGRAAPERDMERLAAGGPRARPLLRLRPAQQRAGPPLPARRGSERYGDPGSSVLGVHSPRFRFTERPTSARGGGCRASGRLAGRGRHRLRDLARLRLPGLAVALPLGDRAARCAGTTSARASTRRPRRRSAPSSEPPGGCRSRSSRCGRATRPGARSSPPTPELLPGGLRAASRGGRAPASRPRGRVRGRRRMCRPRRRWPVELRIDGGNRLRSRSTTRASTSSSRGAVTATHRLELSPAPGFSSIRSVRGRSA